MTTSEIMQRVVEIHNHIVQVYVAGDSAVLIGDSIKNLRLLARQLQEQIETEQTEFSKGENENE